MGACSLSAKSVCSLPKLTAVCPIFNLTVPCMSRERPLALPSLRQPLVRHDLCIQPHNIQFVGYGGWEGGMGELKLTASPVPRLRNLVALSLEA